MEPRAALRIAGILAIGALAFTLVLGVSAAGVFRGARPGTALEWSPVDATASANLAALILASESSPDVRETARAVSVAALRRDPTTVAAFRVLGLAADAVGDQAKALQLFTAAERMSRRDQATQAWLIVYYFRRGDAHRTMHHFDTALRTTNRRLDTLLPLLVRVSSDRRMLPGLRSLVEARPNWWSDFASHLVRSGQPLDHVVFLTRGMLDSADPAQATLIQLLMARLVEAERFDRAWNLYRQQRPRGGAPASLRNGDFEGNGSFAPFDWELIDEIGLAGTAQARPGGGNALYLSASSGRSGAVARQLVRLPAGVYRIQLEMAEIPTNAGQRPRISVRCAGDDGLALLDVRPPASGQGPVRVAARFVVPAGCAWQWLSLQATDQGAGAATSPWVDNIVIAPAP